MAVATSESDSQCRACMNPHGSEKFNLLDTAKLTQLYIRISLSHVDSTDALPKSICATCYRLVNDFDRFQTMCAESYKLLLVQCTKIDLPNILTTIPELKLEEPKLEDPECVDNLELEVHDYENLDDNDDDQYDVDYDPLNDEDRSSSSSTSEDDAGVFQCDFEVKEEDLSEKVEEDVVPTSPTTGKTVKQEPTLKDEIKKEATKREKGVKGRPKQYSCDKCPKTFYKADRFEGHMRQHKGLKPFACQQCNKQYSKLTRLNNHMLNDHSDNPMRFDCKFEGCNKMYRNRESLSTHESKQHGPRKTEEKGEKTVFVCELCGKTLSSRGVLRKHSMIHKDEFPFACDQCPKKYRTHHRLLLHTMRHKGIKNYQCPECGLKKTTGHELNVHMNVHTKAKKFPCKLCSACFLNNGNLVRHIKVVHDGIKTFACTFCDLAFGKAETLKHHVMRHTGERPHECPICNKRFIQKTSFQLHVKRHDKVKNKVSNNTKNINIKKK